MNDTWTRRLLLASAAWNIAGGATSLLDPASHLARMYAVAPRAGDLAMAGLFAWAFLAQVRRPQSTQWVWNFPARSSRSYLWAPK